MINRSTRLKYMLSQICYHGVSTFKWIKYRTPNLLSNYQMVVLNLLDQVAKGWLMKTVKDMRTWFDFWVGLVWFE